MKVFVYRDGCRSGNNFYIATRKPTSNDWNDTIDGYNPFYTKRPESQLPLSICTLTIRKMAREAGRKLPSIGSKDVLELELTIK